MNLIYSGQYKNIVGESIFLAGCSPREGQTILWRKDAIERYGQLEFKGTLIIPEPEPSEPWHDFINVVEWEDYYLKLASKIIFWIPRSIHDEIYGFTSNVEFGMYLYSGKVVYGRPDDSDNNRYLDYWYKKLYNYDPFNELFDLIDSSINHTFLFKAYEL